jgi:hypothetical protein
MNTWYYLKRWYKLYQPKLVVIKKTKKKDIDTKEEIRLHEKLHKSVTHPRKQRDNTKLTKNQILRIRLIWSGKGDPFPNVKNLDRLTKYCNDKLNIHKSRSVYHRIVNNQGAYSSTGFLLDDTKDFKLED